MWCINWRVTSVYHRCLSRLGLHLAEAALMRGDKVVATARKLASVADLSERLGDDVLPLALDLTEPEQVRHVVRQAHAHFGKLDVMLNNTGYTLVGTVEEASEVVSGFIRDELLRSRFGSFRPPCPAPGTRRYKLARSNRWEEVLCKLPSFPP